MCLVAPRIGTMLFGRRSAAEAKGFHRRISDHGGRRQHALSRPAFTREATTSCCSLQPVQLCAKRAVLYYRLYMRPADLPAMMAIAVWLPQCSHLNSPHLRKVSLAR